MLLGCNSIIEISPMKTIWKYLLKSKSFLELCPTHRLTHIQNDVSKSDYCYIIYISKRLETT